MTHSMCPLKRLPSLQALVAVGSGPVCPPVPCQHTGGHLWPWDLVSPGPNSPGTRLCLTLSLGSGGSQLGGSGVPEPRGHSVSPPILGTSGSKRPGPGGTRGHFLPLPGPKVSSQTPKNSRELVFSLLLRHCLRAGPPHLVSSGGIQAPDPTRWVSPCPGWDTLQDTAPQGETDDLFPGQVPREPEPPLPPTRMALEGTKRAGAVPCPPTFLSVGVPNLHGPSPHMRSQAPPEMVGP